MESLRDYLMGRHFSAGLADAVQCAYEGGMAGVRLLATMLRDEDHDYSVEIVGAVEAWRDMTDMQETMLGL